MDIWVLHGAEDELCKQYDGTIWEVGTGPEPVTDTHDNCACTRDVFANKLLTNQKVNPFHLFPWLKAKS